MASDSLVKGIGMQIERIVEKKNEWLAGSIIRKSALAIFMLGAATTAQSGEGLPGDLLVSAFSSDNLVAFDEWSGKVITEYTGAGADLDGTLGVKLGPDNLLYVASEESNMVLRFDPNTRSLVDRFVWDDPATPNFDETGGLNGASSVAFDAQGNLYVGSFDNDAIYQYDGTTGTFERIFVTSGSGGLNGPDAGMTFGSDGNLYVPGFYSNSITYYDGTTGALLGDFVPKGSNGMSRPRHLIFRGDYLYVACEGSHNVKRFDASDGTFVDDFVGVGAGGLREPSGIGWGWCGWMDKWESAEPVMQHSGLQDPFGNRYRPMVDALSAFSAEMYDIATADNPF